MGGGPLLLGGRLGDAPALPLEALLFAEQLLELLLRLLLQGGEHRFRILVRHVQHHLRRCHPAALDESLEGRRRLDLLEVREHPGIEVVAHLLDHFLPLLARAHLPSALLGARSIVLAGSARRTAASELLLARVVDRFKLARGVLLDVHGVDGAVLPGLSELGATAVRRLVLVLVLRPCDVRVARALGGGAAVLPFLTDALCLLAQIRDGLAVPGRLFFRKVLVGVLSRLARLSARPAGCGMCQHTGSFGHPHVLTLAPAATRPL
ncbi:MAG: hypothetical protein R3B70_25955 [Polyangiaceae bacterium]